MGPDTPWCMADMMTPEWGGHRAAVSAPDADAAAVVKGSDTTAVPPGYISPTGRCRVLAALHAGSTCVHASRRPVMFPSRHETIHPINF